MINKRVFRNYTLGEVYLTSWYGGNKRMICKFIKVTEKGYNFLDVRTNTCILKQHLYRSKKPYHQERLTFFVNAKLNTIPSYEQFQNSN